MVFAVSNRGESLVAVTAVVWLLSCVGPFVYQQVTLFSKDLSTLHEVTLEQILTAMRRLFMEIEPRLPGERFQTVLDSAHKLVGVLVTAFMMLEVLLQLKSLSTPVVRALEDSIRKLWRLN